MRRIEKVAGSPRLLAKVVAEGMDKPSRCRYCDELPRFGEPHRCPAENDERGHCMFHIEMWLGQGLPERKPRKRKEGCHGQDKKEDGYPR